MKEPLALLAQWYQDGLFRQDFFTLNTSDSIQDIAASTCGIHFTPSWGAWLDTVQNDPETVWAFANVPVASNGVRARHTENNFKPDPFAFRSGFEHIDQIFTITNWLQELTEDYDRRFHGWEGGDYVWDGDQVVGGDHGWMSMAPGPIGTRGSGMIDPKHIGNQIRYQLDEWGAIPEGERDAFMELSLADPTGVQVLSKESRLFILETADLGKITAYQNLPTATMVERQVDLDKIRDETILGIIIGERPLSAFDDYVAQYKSLGGDQISAEVNEWWASRS
jgi:putative aldouronate transport system substrate-binding protein